MNSEFGIKLIVIHLRSFDFFYGPGINWVTYRTSNVNPIINIHLEYIGSPKQKIGLSHFGLDLGLGLGYKLGTLSICQRSAWKQEKRKTLPRLVF